MSPLHQVSEFSKLLFFPIFFTVFEGTEERGPPHPHPSSVRPLDPVTLTWVTRQALCDRQASEPSPKPGAGAKSQEPGTLVSLP